MKSVWRHWDHLTALNPQTFRFSFVQGRDVLQSLLFTYSIRMYYVLFFMVTFSGHVRTWPAMAAAASFLGQPQSPNLCEVACSLECSDNSTVFFSLAFSFIFFLLFYYVLCNSFFLFICIAHGRFTAAGHSVGYRPGVLLFFRYTIPA